MDIKMVQNPKQKKIQILPIFSWKVPKDNRKLVFFALFQTKTEKI